MIKRYTMPLLFVLGLVAGSVGTGVVALANQPHMQNALNALYTARNELNAASSNKQGHRANAINYVNDAISETRAGIAAANGY
jgi:hypothetical protein